MLDGRKQFLHQPFLIALAHIGGGGGFHPFGVDPCTAQHAVDAAAARIGYDDDCSALFARAAGAARTVLERLGIARDFDVDDEAERRKIDTACGDIGRDADLGAAVAKRLQRRVALILAMLARQRDRGETALDQAGVEAAHIVARRAEEHCGFGVVQAEQVDDRALDIGGGDGHRLISDVAMAAVLADGRNAQRVLLIPLGELDDRVGDRGGEEQGAASRWGAVEDFLKIVAKAHVEHFVGFVEHRDAQRRQVERAAFEVIAQTPRRADDDLHALAERAAFLAGVHAADAGRDARAGLCVEPAQFAADLQREFARRRDDQRERRGCEGHTAVFEQLVTHCEAESDGLARAGLRRDEEVAALGLILANLRLDGGERFIAARDKGVRKDGGKIFERHFYLDKRRSPVR